MKPKMSIALQEEDLEVLHFLLQRLQVHLWAHHQVQLHKLGHLRLLPQDNQLGLLKCHLPKKSKFCGASSSVWEHATSIRTLDTLPTKTTSVFSSQEIVLISLTPFTTLVVTIQQQEYWKTTLWWVTWSPSSEYQLMPMTIWDDLAMVQSWSPTRNSFISHSLFLRF